MVRQKLSEEERKTKEKMRHKEYYKKNKAHAQEQSAKYYENNKDKIKKDVAKYRVENKEKIKEKSAKYREENKEKLREKGVEFRKKNPDKIKDRRTRYYKKNSEKIIRKQAKYAAENSDKIKDYHSKHYIELKNKMYEILGDKCVVCGEKNERFLTIDHLNNDGAAKRKKFSGNLNEWTDLKKRGWPIDEIKNNFQILCYNHNCSKNRTYLNKEYSELNRYSIWQRNAWIDAFNFFGPCHCGQSDLKFLTISHVHDDGAERRRNGEGRGVKLLVEFHRQGWTESLKEDFRLECFNCNCGRANAVVEGVL